MLFRSVIMDDAFMYHAHNLFLWNFVCNGSRFIMSNSIEHELRKRALERIFHESCGSFPPLLPFPCVSSNKLNNCSFLWFTCKHVSDFGSPCDIHVSMIFHIDDLCVAANLKSNFSFLMFVGHHNDILSMSCHELFGFWPIIGVATNLLKTCSFLYFVGTHDGDDKSLPQILWFTNFSF